MNALLEDGLGLVDLKLGLEVAQVVRIAAAVGATTCVGEVELLVKDLIANLAPVRQLASGGVPIGQEI